MREVRTFTDIEIRAEDETPGVTLQAIKPGVVDDYGSLWKADAFDESLGQRLPVLCWSHDWTDPLGPGVDAVTGRGGPKIRFNFSDFDAVPQARRAHAQVKDGTIRDCSVGFSNVQRREPTDSEREKHGPEIREVIERATLDEVSLVLRGAVPGAKVLAVRSARTRAGGAIDMEALYDIARKKSAGELTDAEAQAAVELLSTGAPEGELVAATEEDAASIEASGEVTALDADILNAEIDAALSTVE